MRMLNPERERGGKVGIGESDGKLGAGWRRGFKRLVIATRSRCNKSSLRASEIVANSCHCNKLLKLPRNRKRWHFWQAYFW